MKGIGITCLACLLLAWVIPLEAKPVSVTCCCAADNDLCRVLTQSGCKVARYKVPGDAVAKAPEGSVVFLLADGYPDRPTEVGDDLFVQAVAKRLKLYVEYPAVLPGFELGETRHIEWERGVVASGDFGPELPALSILAIHDCYFRPLEANNPWLVVARVAGFDTAVFGLPEMVYPVLFELPEGQGFVATTKLSQFVTARYAPTAAWTVIWEKLLAHLGVDVKLTWQPKVQPAYGPKEPLPVEAEAQSLAAWANWYFDAGMLMTTTRKAEVVSLLTEDQYLGEGQMPEVIEPGDGASGLLEGFSSSIKYDGKQLQRLPSRADCHGEAALVLALDGLVNHNKRSQQAAQNLLDYIYFTSQFCKGDRANPLHPSYGLIAWGELQTPWAIANYGDDCSRTMLGTLGTAACLKETRWNVSLLKALLANLRTTGPEGFRNDRIDMPLLEQYGWKFFEDTSRVNLSTHFESYLWACYLWAYSHTGYAPFLEKAKSGIKLIMEAGPNNWRWGDTLERSRVLLCLAWLVRVEDTPEHREWVYQMAHELAKVQAPCGALQERTNETKVGGFYFAASSNESYGTTEVPLIQQNGDPASDQLYTSGFALLGLHEAVCATGDMRIKELEDKLAAYLCRIQVEAPDTPWLDGCWFRAFNYDRWEYWASSGDVGWGAWSVETGWAQAWSAITLGLREQDTSLWELSSRLDLASIFAEVKADLDRTPAGPWQPEG